MDPRATQVLQYWFTSPGDPEWGQLRKLWFGGGVAVDDEIRARFGALHQQAVAGELDAWSATALGCLALVVVLDQFSRNLHRGTAQAFAADARALQLAKGALERGFDQQVEPVQRWFFYLPFEHAESLVDQQRAVALFEALPDDSVGKAIGCDFARKHLDVIERFGRFPHRNPMLGRETTAAEQAWLDAGGARFG